QEPTDESDTVTAAPVTSNTEPNVSGQSITRPFQRPVNSVDSILTTIEPAGEYISNHDAPSQRQNSELSRLITFQDPPPAQNSPFLMSVTPQQPPMETSANCTIPGPGISQPDYSASV